MASRTGMKTGNVFFIVSFNHDGYTRYYTENTFSSDVDDAFRFDVESKADVVRDELRRIFPKALEKDIRTRRVDEVLSVKLSD